MEYGQSERSEPDPVTEGSGEGGDSGVGESMWNMGLGEGGGGTGGVGGVGGGESSYPERPGEANCIYYMRTGFCGYGERCRFNHPRDRGEVAYGGGRAGGAGGDYPERDGQPVCQYYMRTGSCKFGSSCKYHHPRHDVGSATAVPLSIYGYPLRPGEKECTYYMKTGQCKFGETCKFHHPLPAGVQLPTSTSNPAPGPTAITAPVVYPTGQSSATPSQYGIAAGSWQVARPPILPGSYIQGPYGPMLLPTGVVPFGGWTPYPVSVSAVPAPSTGSTVEAGQLYGIPSTSRLSAKAPAYTRGTGPSPAISSSSSGPSSSIQKEPSYPERPGQPECQHYMRTGECKYGPSCRYHHPAERTGQRESFSLTPMGLPSRPGAAPCSFFMQHGICKFGPTCKYNHPMGSLSYSPSTSSLSDMPIAPYPVGSSIVTLAPASSSSDIRTEVITGSSYNPTTIYASPSDNVLPKNGSDLQSGTQQPGQSSTTKASPSHTSEQEDDTRA